MVELNSKQEVFVAMMVESDEYARHGTTLLLERPDFEEFFDSLSSAGFFNPSRNPPPVQASEPGSFRVPYWVPLDYLVAVAKVAGEKNDVALAQKICTVVRAVSNMRASDGTVVDNHHTFRRFAEILGLLPSETTTIEDVELISTWLRSRFDRGMVCRALDVGALPKFLNSSSEGDTKKACAIVRNCIQIRWVNEDSPLETDRGKPITAADDYWLKKLLEHHAHLLGSKAGREGIEIFLPPIREVYDKRSRRPSWIWRPAIEEHEQNHAWNGAENRLVEGMRDTLIGFISASPAVGASQTADLLKDKSEIVRRIAIYALNELFDKIRTITESVITPLLFDQGHLHETYALLKNRFSQFSDAEKNATLKAIRKIPPPQRAEDSVRALRYIQRTWLSNLVGKGLPEADEWFGELLSDPMLGPMPEHPDFHSYMESWMGPGPSAFRPEELLAFTQEGTLISRLNEFVQTSSWRGPTKRALVDALEAAILQEPSVFLSELPSFLDAQRPYQYGVLHAFERLWEKGTKNSDSFDWSVAWPKLIDFCQSLVSDENLWSEPVEEDRDVTPTRLWIPPVIADMLHDGTKNDETAYAPALLPKSLEIIEILLNRVTCIDTPNINDAMTETINSSKGKAIEALISHALRACRLSDKGAQDHSATWKSLEPLFQNEINKCKNTNYEFSTLAGSYIANFLYMNSEWTAANLSAVFPPQFPTNKLCAFDGLAYAPASLPVYRLLRDNGVIVSGLNECQADTRARERLIQRIALAYIWGEEKLDSPRFAYLFDSTRSEEDIGEVSDFFWGLSDQELNSRQRSNILDFWRKAVDFASKKDRVRKELLSTLSRLAVYVESVDKGSMACLLAVAPFIEIGFNADEFVEQLLRLSDHYPNEVSEILGKVLDTYQPSFDFEGKMRTLITSLAGKGHRLEALTYAERLVPYLPDMLKLYEELTAGS